MPSLAVIDFETTGATPAQGARATEVAICLLEGGRIVDRFASLMNTGVRIPSFITQLTGRVGDARSGGFRRLAPHGGAQRGV
jgi:DNA polymerase III subunit epsilon